jgi:protein-disulfide isomerase
MSGNDETCPFCKEEIICKTDEERFEELKKRVDVNDAIITMDSMGCSKIWQRERNYGNKPLNLGPVRLTITWVFFFDDGGDLKKSKFHWEAAAMAGH